MAPRDSETLARLRLPSWRSLRLPLLLVLVFVAVASTVWAALANYFLVSRDPEAPVGRYLGYLEGGSSRQVLAPLLIGGDRPLAQLLSNGVYRDAANRPQGHDFVGVQNHGEHAAVGVDIHLGDGSTVHREYTVEKVASWGPFNDSWRLVERDNAIVDVRLPAAVDAASVNGNKVRPNGSELFPTDPSDPGSPARTWQFEGLPGVYDIAMPEDSYLLASEHASAEISMSDPRSAAVELDFTASPHMWEGAERAVQDAVGQCERVLRFDAAQCPLPAQLGGGPAASPSASPSASPTGAPTEVPPGVSNIRWELQSRPSLLLAQDDDDPLAFHAVRFRPAVATVTWLQNGRQHSGTVGFGIDVTARTNGEDLDTDVQLRSTLTERERASQRS